MDDDRCCDLGFFIKTSEGQTVFARPQADLLAAGELINKLGGPANELVLFGSTDTDNVHFLEAFSKYVAASITLKRLTLVSIELGDPNDLITRLSFQVIDALELMDCHGVKHLLQSLSELKLQLSTFL